MLHIFEKLGAVEVDGSGTECIVGHLLTELNAIMKTACGLVFVNYNDPGRGG